jgi:hypothetical protein
MADIVSKIDGALANMKAGTFTGSVVLLLEEARKGLAIQHTAETEAKKMTAQAAWEAHGKFAERLAEILKLKIETEDLQEGESLQWCYVTNFYATPASRRGDDDREATVTIRGADIRIRTSEDIAPPHSRIEWSDRYGCHYREPRAEMWTFPERWMRDDDWKEQFRRRSLEIQLAMARHRRREAIKSRDELETKKLAEAKGRVLDLTAQCERIAEAMKALGMEVPAERKEG